ncbi:MAG: hypothetical protein MUF47_03710 [Porphyrobacter sp.]|nr:hypothetical protein [Porphyrobacter sp.]
MTTAGGDHSAYGVPQGVLGLVGPVEKPAPGTLPLRGDLAHMALAHSHLAAHYVIPHARMVGAGGASLHMAPRADSEAHHQLAAGTAIELLDIAGEWAWICLGPQGPSGYCLTAQLAPEDASA